MPKWIRRKTPNFFFVKLKQLCNFLRKFLSFACACAMFDRCARGKFSSYSRAPLSQQQQSPQFCTEKKWSVRLDNDGLIYFFLSNRVDSVLIFTRVIAWRKIIVHYLYIRLIYVSRRIDRADIVARCCTNIVLKNPKWIQYLWEVVRRKGGPMGVKSNFFQKFLIF